MSRFVLFQFIAIGLLPQLHAAAPPTPPRELNDYIEKKDDSFRWKYLDKLETPSGTIYSLEMTSQKWQGIVWKHDLQVFMPKDAKPHSTMVLYNTGGSPNPATTLLGITIAQKIGAPIAFQYGLPNQPIYGKKEDDLIAETFVKYLETKDATWPLLFPMAKSIVKGMDALQAFAQQQWKFEVKDFVITGASKRGWTSWMTAASGDKRVKAIVPMVIDMLNFSQQMPHQVKSYGQYSAMIQDYTKRGLLKPERDATAEKLWKMVDPWTYRGIVKQPKLIVNGTNDPYWSQDALNLYWDDLQGDKWVLYVPNAGHGLDQAKEDGVKSRERALNTLSAFARCMIDDKPFPTPTWKNDTAGSMECVKIDGGKDVKKIRMWEAVSTTRDFRKAVWKESELKLDETCTTMELLAPKTGYRAIFAECEYQMGELTFTLSTQIKILPEKK